MMKRILYFLFALGFFMSGTLVSVERTKAGGEEDFAIPNGHFYTQTTNGEGGFAVVDDGEARFWAEFQRLGGLQTVGYPISRRYVYDGFVTQAFQKLLLQWRPDVEQAWPVNVFDELSDNGFNDQLFSIRQTPYPLIDFDPPNATWEEVVAARQGLLDDNSAIRDRYFSVADPLNVFGLPTSGVEDMGNHYAVRTQRAVFQQWKEDVPWAFAGEVTIANGGDIAKEMGWLSGSALDPEPIPSAGNNLESFSTELKQAVMAKNYAELPAKMNDPFGVGFWLSEGRGFSPNEAIDFLRQQYLTTNNNIVFPESQPDIRALLGGFDPENLVNPDANVAQILFSKGWGREGESEALLFITQEAGGSYAWDTIIIAHSGFQRSGPQEEPTKEELLNNFQNTLESTIIERNYNMMRRFMRSSFNFGFWRGGGFARSPNGAIKQLRNNYIGHNHAISFPKPQPNLSELLDGQDPLLIWGPEANVIRAVYSDKGWGSDGQGAAILAIAEDANGIAYWYGVLIAPNGF
ncbi:MAG: hypothetical protein ACPGWR_29875 [Ardenticatenaceae bacterium]